MWRGGGCVYASLCVCACARVCVHVWLGGLPKCLTCSLCLLSDKMFPALGFGAQLPPDWKVSDVDATSFGGDGTGVGAEWSGGLRLLSAHTTPVS